MPSSPPHTEAVIFDWGGTLSVWAEVEMEDMWRLAAEHVSGVTGADFEAVLGRLVEIEDRLWVECAETARGARSFRLVDVLEAASAVLGVDVAAAVLEEASNRHLDSWTPHVTHDPDAVTTLEALKRRGLRIGLLSNTHWPARFHEHFLERDGLLDLIDVRVYSSEEARMKPHPDIFRATLDRMGAQPARTMFVGDRMWDDVWGAQQAGMRGVWKRTPHAKHRDGVVPDAVVTRLPDLLDLLGRP